MELTQTEKKSSCWKWGSATEESPG